MPYAQTNYPQKLGTGAKAVSIAAAGCFVTAFCDLLEDNNRSIDPATLNQWFIDHGSYIFESDGTKDLLSWGSITAFDPNIRVIASGSGAPSSNNSIVKFVYGGGKTHFCKVQDAAAGTIIDAWDGKVKSWNVYGGPVAYATYTSDAPAATTTAKDPRWQVVETYNPAKQVRLNKQPTNLWGMNYDFNYMVGHPVEVHNAGEVWGVTEKVRHEDGMFYYRREGQVDGFNILDCDDFTPPPEVPVVPAPQPVAEPAKPANTVYTKLANVQNLLVNRDTHKWALDFPDDAPGDVHAVADLTSGTPFVAFGLAQRTDHDKPAYFMTEEDFGNADQSGTPNSNVGVNTVDLSPAPSTPAAPTEPLTPPPLPSPAPAASDTIHVTVKASDWHNTFTAYLSPQKFVANANVEVHEVDETIPVTTDHPAAQQLIRGQTVTIAGTFTRDGIKYYRTALSVAKGYWYGIPVISITKLTDAEEVDELDKIFDEIDADVKAVGAKVKTGNVEGFISRVFNHKK